MQDPKTHKRTNQLTISKVVTVIGISLLLCTTAYMSYVAIDAEALRSSLRQHRE